MTYRHIPEDIAIEAERVAKEAARSAMIDPLMPFFVTAKPHIADALAFERERHDNVYSVLNDIVSALKVDAVGTPLNNHKYDALGIRAHDALRNRPRK